MSSGKRIPHLSALNRRDLLAGTAALSATAMLAPAALAQQFPTAKVNTTGLAVTDTEVTVGILHSVTGTMAISETGSVQAEKLAIEQINAEGGVLGRKIKFIQEDGGSDWPTFAEKQEAPRERQGRFRHGMLDVSFAQGGAAGVRTVQRHAVLSDLYEGLEQSKNVIYTGQRRRSRSSPASIGCRRRRTPRPSICSAPTTSGRTSNKIARNTRELPQAESRGRRILPARHTQFNSVINKMKLTKPDVIYAIIVGGSMSPSTSSSRRPGSISTSRR
jgi:urea transport system substrate-binding protein